MSEFNKRVTDKDDMIVPVTVGDNSELENDQPVTRKLILSSSRPIPRPYQTQSIPIHSILLVKRVKNGFGADIKIIFAPPHPTHPTMKLFLMEMDSRAYFKTFLLW